MKKKYICNNCKTVWDYNNTCTCGCTVLTETHPSNKSNTKEYKQLDINLFEAYMNKFSTKDRLMILHRLMSYEFIASDLYGDNAKNKAEDLLSLLWYQIQD